MLNDTSPTTFPTSIDTTVNGQQLGLSVLIYGSLGLTLVVIFSFVRTYARHVYSPRKHHVSEQELPPKELPKSIFKWPLPLLSASFDDLVLQHVGLDSYVTLRFLILGCKVFLCYSVIGLVVLVPVYYTQGDVSNLGSSASSIDKISFQYIVSSMGLLWLPCMFVFVYTAIALYLLHHEYLHVIPLLREYKLSRDRTLYTILVERIPKEIFSSTALIRYFESLFPGEVLRVDIVPMNQVAQELKKVVDERNDVVARLERAKLEEHYHNDNHTQQAVAAWKKSKIVFPSHLSWMGLRGFCYGRLCACFGDRVDAVEYYEARLRELNDSMGLLKERLLTDMIKNKNAEYAFSNKDNSDEEAFEHSPESKWTFSMEKAEEVEYLLERHPFNDDDVEPSAAFVTFKSKAASTCAKQTIISAEDQHFLVTRACGTQEVNWSRLGKNPRVIIASRIGVVLLNFVLLVLFGVLTSTISATTNAEAIREGWPQLNEFLTEHPSAAVLFDQIAPLLLIISFALVPPILNLILELRFEVSDSRKDISFFLNYSAFLIVQMFLFYQLSGAIFSVLAQSWNNPREFVNVIADAISRQSTFYMQFICIRALWVLPTELFRLGDIAVAFLVTPIFCGLKRTPREKRDDTCGCRDFSFAGDAWLGLIQAQVVLILSIGITYSVFAPLSSPFALLYFAIALVVYRNQFMYVYVKKFESGGASWPFLALLFLFALLLFQVSMLGIFALNSAGAQSAMMVLPIAATIIYGSYMNSDFQSQSDYLSVSDARKFDIQNAQARPPLTPLDYTHPILAEPDNKEPDTVPHMLRELEVLRQPEVNSSVGQGESFAPLQASPPDTERISMT